MVDNLNPDTAGVSAGAGPAVDEALITYTHVIYALHALAALIGLTTAATVVGSFVCGIPSIVAVVMNYVRRAATRGTFLESHFRWQIRTFWFALLWVVVIWAVTLPLFVVLIGFPLFFAGFVALGVWIIYRVVRGWLALRDRRPMYV
jgi:uncharacterized membrane protein